MTIELYVIPLKAILSESNYYPLDFDLYKNAKMRELFVNRVIQLVKYQTNKNDHHTQIPTKHIFKY